MAQGSERTAAATAKSAANRSERKAKRLAALLRHDPSAFVVGERLRLKDGPDTVYTVTAVSKSSLRAEAPGELLLLDSSFFDRAATTEGR